MALSEEDQLYIVEGLKSVAKDIEQGKLEVLSYRFSEFPHNGNIEVSFIVVPRLGRRRNVEVPKV